MFLSLFHFLVSFLSLSLPFFSLSLSPFLSLALSLSRFLSHTHPLSSSLSHTPNTHTHKHTCTQIWSSVCSWRGNLADVPRSAPTSSTNRCVPACASLCVCMRVCVHAHAPACACTCYSLNQTQLYITSDEFMCVYVHVRAYLTRPIHVCVCACWWIVQHVHVGEWFKMWCVLWISHVTHYCVCVCVCAWTNQDGSFVYLMSSTHMCVYQDLQQKRGGEDLKTCLCALVCGVV